MRLIKVIRYNNFIDINTGLNLGKIIWSDNVYWYKDINWKTIKRDTSWGKIRYWL